MYKIYIMYIIYILCCCYGQYDAFESIILRIFVLYIYSRGGIWVNTQFSTSAEKEITVNIL